MTFQHSQKSVKEFINNGWHLHCELNMLSKAKMLDHCVLQLRANCIIFQDILCNFGCKIILHAGSTLLRWSLVLTLIVITLICSTKNNLIFKIVIYSLCSVIDVLCQNCSLILTHFECCIKMGSDVIYQIQWWPVSKKYFWQPGSDNITFYFLKSIWTMVTRTWNLQLPTNSDIQWYPVLSLCISQVKTAGVEFWRKYF